MNEFFSRIYRALVLEHPLATLVVLTMLFAFFAYHTKDFRLDASADSLLLEEDKALKQFREVSERYKTRELLIATFTPNEDLFSDSALSHLKQLRDELRAVASVDSINTILDVPLLKSSNVPLTELAQNVQTLEMGTIEKARAKEELSNSPVFKNFLLSEDGRTTALLMNLKENSGYSALRKARSSLLAKNRSGEISEAEGRELARISAEYDTLQATLNNKRHQDVETIRSIMARYKQYGVIYLGGVPMITDDMVSFVRNDLIIFGAGVLVFLIAVLALIFREVRWVVLPLLSCFYAGLIMIGMLGFAGWKVTVISSNFLALMLIITISMNIHLAVRYRQLRRDNPSASRTDLVVETTNKMVRPCLYTALTTIIGFSSLVFSEIKPVIDFGWMMSIGLSVTFLTSFLLFPSVLILIGGSPATQTGEKTFALTRYLASLTERHGNKVVAVAFVLAIASAIGISKLQVENAFINYFSNDTEIYKGMKVIDEQLGGTTPLDIILHLDEEVAPVQAQEESSSKDEKDDEFDDLEKLYEEEVSASPEDYWFTAYKINRIKKVHDYLDSLPEVGKVLSLASVLRVAEELNDGEELDSLQLALLYKKIPADIRTSILDPFISIENNEARIFLRILDSSENLRRKELLEKIDRDLAGELKLSDEDYTITGLLVLYNNMLQSLFKSQIATLGFVMLGIALMFMILFRSVVLSIIGIVPNVLGALVVLGIMGWVGIPLDMMTITIAAITIGIAVDNGIHYIYRFREELAQNGNYIETLHLCHATIGRAVFYTTVTIVFGFSILVLSNFKPTIYFGVLTGLAVLIALLAALTLLPKLILMWRPFD